MITEDFYIASNDESQQLHCVVWSQVTEPVAVLQLVHGMEEYIARYAPLAEALVSRGWAVIGHDHLGHGESGRWERGFFTEREDGDRVLIDDIACVNRLAHDRWPGIPLMIFGHSMGSFFLRRYLSEYGSTLDGAVICGSGWYNALATGTGYWSARIIGGIRDWHTKSWLLTTICSLPFIFAFRSEGRLAWLSRNKTNVAAYESDPLCGFGFTCGGYRFMYRNLLLVSREYHFEQLRPVPLLVISGGDDPVGGKSAVPRIAFQYRRYGFTDVTERILADDRHEILFEVDAPDTIAYIADWLESRRPVAK